MNNEIKEINIKIPGQILDYVDTKEHLLKLFNYITNLQQENERLKDNRDWWKDRFFGQQEYDDSHRITAIEYKKRIDKAIEYIENQTSLFDKCYFSGFKDLLNILQNGSDDNE